MTNFSREKMLDVIYKLIPKEPTEVVKSVFAEKKTVERLSIDIIEEPQKFR